MPDKSDTSATRATQVQHQCDTSNTSPTRVRHEWHECDTSATRTIWVRYEWKILILITTHIFGKYKGVKTYFYTLIFTIWQVKDYRVGNSFIQGTIFWKCLFYAKIRLKSAPQKLNFLMAKAISKRCTLDCSCKQMPFRVSA